MQWGEFSSSLEVILPYILSSCLIVIIDYESTCNNCNAPKKTVNIFAAMMRIGALRKVCCTSALLLDDGDILLLREEHQCAGGMVYNSSGIGGGLPVIFALFFCWLSSWLCVAVLRMEKLNSYIPNFRKKSFKLTGKPFLI